MTQRLTALLVSDPKQTYDVALRESDSAVIVTSVPAVPVPITS